MIKTNKMFKPIIGIAFFCAVCLHASEQPEIRFKDLQSNFFPDSVVTAVVEITTSSPFQGMLAWEFNTLGAVISRNETAAVLPEQGKLDVSFELRIPPARQDLAISAGLRVGLSGTGLTNALTIGKRLWILGRVPWEGRREWLKQQGILLFDPDKTTAPLLEKADIPFTLTSNLSALPENGCKILLIAEGIDFLDYRGLPEAMLRAAASGVSVICLAPANGEIELPNTGFEGLPLPCSLRLMDKSIITTLDKHLDAEWWGVSEKAVKSLINVRGENGYIALTVNSSQNGWPWLEIFFPNDSGIILTGFAVESQWKETPAARHFFLRMLEYLEKKEKK